MTSTAVGVSNLVLGTVYTCYGFMTIVDLRRGWRINGVSQFGIAWLLMAFTCGPHHLDHGLHVLAAGRSGATLDLAAVLIGFPAGVAWFLLRVEAMFGGRGDRSIGGTPAWLGMAPTVSAMYLAAVAAGLTGILFGIDRLDAWTLPNVALVALYGAIGALLLRTQLRNHAATGAWSVSGLTLSAVMVTCAVMHAVYVGYVHAGRYDLDVHAKVIDTVGVPAAAYFLWVTYALYRGTLRDWDTAATTTATPVATAVA